MAIFVASCSGNDDDTLFESSMEIEEEIVVETGSLFDIGFSVKGNQSNLVDALYLADGPWGVDYITEEVYKDNFYSKVFDHSESSINIWNREITDDLGLQYYGVVKNVRETKQTGEGRVFLKEPNPIDFSHFVVDVNLKNLLLL